MTVSKQRIDALCRIAPGLLTVVPSGIDPEKLMKAIAQVESTYGEHSNPKHEIAFDWGGKYADRTALTTWGSDAACSYGPWQVMFPTAVRFLTGIAPRDLESPETCFLAAIGYLNDIFRRMARRQDPQRHDLDEIADAYNSGNHEDRFIPADYITKLRAAYQKHGGTP